MDRSRGYAADSGTTGLPVQPALRSAGLFTILLAVLACLALWPVAAYAQGGSATTPTPAPRETPIQAPDKVEVQPRARDEEIRARLEDILKATGWFTSPVVEVQDGVVFLRGQADTEEYKKWAGDLARSTQDVAAVVNQMDVVVPDVWDFSPVVAGLREQGRDVVRALPLVGFSVFILAIAYGLARLTAFLAGKSLRRRNINPLLVDVIGRGIGLAVFILGLYFVFQVAGLTSVAFTVLGGTGLLGLILGIAFRDITENFLASIFLSMQNPFRTGDMVEIAGVAGFVQALTTRATVLMTLDGNHVQIPNATVYKSTIENYTSNPNRRIEFGIGIGFDDDIPTAQEVALKVLEEHPAVLKEPEPWVLVDSLGSATVNLRVSFWLDGSEYSWLKVKSSVIRLVKRAFQDAGISMPDEARETVFPQGIPVRLLQPDGATESGPESPHLPTTSRRRTAEAVSTDAEGGLRSEAPEIEQQARQARTPEEGENLLSPADS